MTLLLQHGNAAYEQRLAQQPRDNSHALHHRIIPKKVRHGAEKVRCNPSARCKRIAAIAQQSIGSVKLI